LPHNGAPPEGRPLKWAGVQRAPKWCPPQRDSSRKAPHTGGSTPEENKREEKTGKKWPLRTPKGGSGTPPGKTPSVPQGLKTWGNVVGEKNTPPGIYNGEKYPGPFEDWGAPEKTQKTSPKDLWAQV